MIKFKNSEITPESIYKKRRSFIKSIGLGASSLAMSTIPFVNKSLASERDKLTSYKDITTYNNYYEFGTSKSDPHRNSQIFKTTPWEIAIEGERIDAKRCLELGLVNKVVAGENLLAEAISWADKLSLRSSQSLSLTKKIMRKSVDSSYEDIYDLEAKTQNTLTGSEDNIEGITAFMEKRQPNFK